MAEPTCPEDDPDYEQQVLAEQEYWRYQREQEAMAYEQWCREQMEDGR